MTAAQRFARLPTAAKLLLILTAVLLPFGVGLAWLGQSGISEANAALDARTRDQGRIATRSIESLIARNALALRLAANGAVADGSGDACRRAQRTLAIAPAVSQQFEIETPDGEPLCTAGNLAHVQGLPIVAPGAIRLAILPASGAVAVRVGVIGAMATALIPAEELRLAVAESGADIWSLALRDGHLELPVLAPAQDRGKDVALSEWPIGNAPLLARVGVLENRITTADRLLLLLPVLVWIAAALLTWLLVSRLLIGPLKRLQGAVQSYQPGHGPLDLPDNLGPATEIQDLRDAFGRAVSRVEQSEQDLTGALDGQRRLVREVHHRVKNNLQVIASLLNIHGRSAESPEASAAYVGIGRRVGALSIVHRNHFAEMEENRGIALRPLIAELAAELRATAPESARAIAIDLDIDTVHTTQDAAVAVAFLITEMVEYVILHCPNEPVEISLRRTSELSAQLRMSNQVLNPEPDGNKDKIQFERIVAGLAKQLRSPLDRKLGRYSVDLPVFPPG
jgi:two-component sensor histidine kinase